MRNEMIRKNLVFVGTTVFFFILFVLFSFFITSYWNRNSIQNELSQLTQNLSSQLEGAQTKEEMYQIVERFEDDHKELSVMIYIDKNTQSGYPSDTEEDGQVYIAKEKIFCHMVIHDNYMLLISRPDSMAKKYVVINILVIVHLIAVCILVMILHVRKMTRLFNVPFSKISSHLKRVNKGEYEQIDIKHQSKEMSLVLEEVNEANNSLYASMLKIKNEHDKINFIINNMQQGMFIIDEFENVLILNNYAKKVLNLDIQDIENTKYQDVISNEIVLEKIKSTLVNKGNITFDIEDTANQKIYSYLLSYLNNKWNDASISVGLLVMVIMDVTEERTNDKLKAEFIANASHELKTPITSIMGFAELLLSIYKNEDAKSKKYLNIIYNESIKMKDMIDELLYLSNLEYHHNQVALREQIYFRPLISELVESYDAMAKKANVEIIQEVEDVYILEHDVLVKHLIGNLLQNAIRYNKPNGKVYIDVKDLGDQVVLTVKDTGIGIEQQHLDKIFERFYRVDESHNRNTGGTGIGLNIVKQICTIIDATLDVESTINVGTTFTVRFKKNE